MNILFILRIVFTICCLSSVIYPQWINSNSSTTASLKSVFFVDENSGWICGDGIILKTNDGSESWTVFNSTERFNSIFFINSLKGWTCGSNGTILNTTDGGINWSEQISGTNAELNYIYFSDDQNGIAAGWEQTILKTTNGGLTWITQTQGGYQQFLNGYVFDDSQMYIVGTAGAIFKSDNGGATWDSSNVGMPNGLFSINFINENTGWIFGCCGSYFKTTNSGNTWVDYGYLTNGNILYSSSFISADTGWTVGEIGWILATTDGGVNWDSLYSGVNTDLFSVTFVNERVGYAVGSQGVILKTNNGGGIITTVQEPESIISKDFFLSQNFPNPFNPLTTIEYTIPEIDDISPENVQLKIFDILGNEIALIVNERKNAGHYSVSFDTRSFSLASGVYYYSLRIGSYSETKKLVLMK